MGILPPIIIQLPHLKPLSEHFKSKGWFLVHHFLKPLDQLQENSTQWSILDERLESNLVEKKREFKEIIDGRKWIIRNGSDQLAWGHGQHDTYTIKEGYRIIMRKYQNSINLPWLRIW